MAMAPVAFSEFLLLFLLSGTPTDLLSFLEPKMALETLGEATDEANLKRLIEGKAAATPAEGAEKPALDEATEKAVKTAIQNLASASDAVRAKAAEKLVQVGEAVRSRLQDVVAKDPKRAEEAKKVLAELGEAAKASESKSGAARILAVRLAGDQKLKGLAGPVKELVSSRDPFLKQAALEVLAQLEGKDPPPAAEHPWAKSLAALEALPAGTRFLVDIPMASAMGILGGAPRIDAFLRSFTAQMAGMGMPADEGDRMLREATRGILDFAAKCGNMRLDRIDVANVGSVGDRGAGLGLILCGEYEPGLLARGLPEMGGFTAEEVRGLKVLSPGKNGPRLVLLDDHNILLLFPEEGSTNFPLDPYLEAFKARSKPLAGDARWAKFLGTLGAGGAKALAVTDETLMTEIYGEVEREVTPEVLAAMKGMKEIEAEAKATDSKKLAYRLEAAFAEAKQASDMADYMKGLIAQGMGELERNAAQFSGSPVEDMMKKVQEVLKSIKCVAEGRKGILRGELDPALLFTGFFGARVIR